MANEWIKVEHITPEKPEVALIAAECNLDIDTVLGKLIKLWIWADRQTILGYAKNVTPASLDRNANLIGFTSALVKAGWLHVDGTSVTFKNFTYHNGKTAKQRAQAVTRMQRYRYARAINTTKQRVYRVVEDFKKAGKEKYLDWVYLSPTDKDSLRKYYAKQNLTDDDIKAAILKLDAWFENNPGMRAKRKDDCKALKGWPLREVLKDKAEKLRVETQQTYKETAEVTAYQKASQL